jgi:hypothetical protein
MLPRAPRYALGRRKEMIGENGRKTRNSSQDSLMFSETSCFYCTQPANQPISQPTNQSINQSINQPITNQSVTNQSINQPTNQSINQSINQSSNQAAEWVK